MYYYNNELYHFGVKGMKWGVRRYQNKDGTLTRAGKRHQRKEVKRERNELEKAEYNRLVKKYNISGKTDAAYDYGRKHNLDLDDGGGGSSKAGAKYLDMLEKIDKLDSKAIANAKTYANEQLIHKYGEKTIEDIKKQDAKIKDAKIIVATSALMLMPVAGLATVFALDNL